MIRTVAIHIGHFALAFLVLNLAVLLYRYKKMPREIKTLIWFLVLNIVTEIYSRTLFAAKSNNLYLLHIYTLFEFITWTIFYRSLFRNKKLPLKFPWFIAIVSGLIIANSIFLEPITGFNSNAKTLVQLLLIGYAVYYFFDSFGKIDLTQTLPRAITLINFAVILYYSGSLFIFMFSKLLANIGIASKHQHGFWAVNALLNLIFQLIIFISIWTAAFRKTKSS